jgi:TetR/AcrR family transcriptional regulator, regulator of autoinduction and epiphytic fitness
MIATVEDLTKHVNEPPEQQPEPLPQQPQPQDGRTLRRLNSFDRAVDALLDLIESGNSSPTAQQIAEKSGISVRTVFRLTEDIEQLHAAAIERQIQRTAHLYVQIPATGSLTTRIRALVENRSRVFEAIAPARRVAERLAESSPQITQGLAFHHDILQMQVGELFGRELSRISRVRRADALSAIDVAASWETWDHLRRIQGLSITSSGRVVRLLIEGVLAK